MAGGQKFQGLLVEPAGQESVWYFCSTFALRNVPEKPGFQAWKIPVESLPGKKIAGNRPQSP